MEVKEYGAGDIVEYIHEEDAYRETGSGEIIPFSFARTIDRFKANAKHHPQAEA